MLLSSRESAHDEISFGVGLVINLLLRITQEKFQYHRVEIGLTLRAYTLHQR